MQKAWADHTFGKTQYLGPVLIAFGEKSNEPENNKDVYHLFSNELQFFDIEMDFEKSTRGTRTLYFTKSNLNWIPSLVAQFDKAQSSLAGTNAAEDVMSSQKDIVIEQDGSVSAVNTKGDLEAGINVMRSRSFDDDAGEDMLMSVGRLQLNTAQVNKKWQSMRKTKAEWDNWDKFLELDNSRSRRRTTENKDTKIKSKKVAQDSFSESEVNSWPEVDRQFFELSCRKLYPADFFEPAFQRKMDQYEVERVVQQRWND